MLPYFLKSRKSKESKNPEVKKTKNGKITLLLTLFVVQFSVAKK